MNTTKQQETLAQQARIGLYFLKEAILETLFNAQDEEPLQTEEIRKRLCLFITDELPDRNNTFILSIISLLQNEGRIESILEERDGWKITETETSRLKERLID